TAHARTRPRPNNCQRAAGDIDDRLTTKVSRPASCDASLDVWRGPLDLPAGLPPVFFQCVPRLHPVVEHAIGPEAAAPRPPLEDEEPAGFGRVVYDLHLHLGVRAIQDCTDGADLNHPKAPAG